MPVDEKTGLGGLVTNVAETQAPPGTLIEAENVVVRRPGCIEPRDGLQLVGTLASGFPAYGFSWRTKDFILRNNGSHVFDWRDTAGALYRYVDYSAFGTVDPQPMRRDVFARAEGRANLYLPYDAGVLKMTSDAGPWVATGVLPFALWSGSPQFTLVTGTWLGNNEQVAYRLVCTKKDANGLVVRSIPSGALLVSNTSGSAKAVQTSIALGGTTTPFAADTVELYRSRNFPTSATPDEELRLVATFTGSALPANNYVDNVAPAAMGAVIYTAPSRGGIAQQNERPPACACTALFRGSLFFGNVRGPRRVKVSYTYASASISTATGIGRRVYTGDITSGNANILNLSSTAGLEKGMLITGAGIQANATITNIVGTTVTMSLTATANTVGVSCNFFDTMNVDGVWRSVVDIPGVIALNASVTRLVAYEITPAESGYGKTVVIEATSRATTARTIQATHGSEYNPPLPNFDGTPLALDQDVWPGAIYWSKPDEPEHVRSIDYDRNIGDQGRALLGLVPTRDALFILKEDGIFRLTGANGVWRVDPFDPTARCVLPGSVRAIRGRGVFLGDRGVAMVSDDGVELVSAAINDQVKPLIDAIVANWASTSFYELSGMAGAHAACVFERESEYTLARGSATAPLVYNDVTGAWTTLAYYGHANESYSYKALFNFERTGSCVLALGVNYFKTLLSTDAGVDYLRNDRATAVTVNSYAAPNATLSAPINALEDDIIKDSAGRYWRVTAAVNNSATVPVLLAGGSAAMATGAATLYRSLRCSVVATGFTQPISAQKRWGAFLTAWTKLTGPVRMRYAYQSSESPVFVEEDANTSLVKAGSGPGYADYALGIAVPARVPNASVRAWLLRARVRWAMAHGDTQLEGISAELAPMEPGSPQQVKA